MANVYLAEDQELGRRVAIKILDDRHASDDQFVERFRREAQNAAGLSHPNIVSIYDRGEAEGTYYIAMEYVEGRTLKELIVARGPSPIGIAIDYTRQILSALRFAHRNGIVHRDIKPHNVIVDGDGRVKVMDFGIARAGTSQMTEAGSIIGTAQYLSPEQARGAPVDQTSDLYSAGIVLYELLTGTVPFNGDTPGRDRDEAPLADAASRPPPSGPRCRATSTTSSCARSPRTRPSATTPPRRWTPTWSGSRAGSAVSAETAEAATTVLARTDVLERRRRSRPPTAPTTLHAPAATTSTTRRAAPPLGLAVAAGAAGCWRSRARRRLLRLPAAPGSAERLEAGHRPATSRACEESLAVRADRGEAGLEPNVRREPSSDVRAGLVAEQDPSPPKRVDQGNFVTIVVSTGKPKVRVPSVVGQQPRRSGRGAAGREPDAERRRGQLGAAHGHGDRAVARRPAATVVEGSTRAHQRLEGAEAGRGAERRRRSRTSRPRRSSRGSASPSRAANVESDEPAGIVVGQDPGAGAVARQGLDDHAAGLRGPADLGDARRRRARTSDRRGPARGPRASGPASCARTPRTRSLDGIVISQDPPGGTEAKPGDDRDDLRRPLRRAAAADRRPSRTDTPPTGHHADDAVSRRAPRRRARGRPLERARDLARVGALGARGARSRAATR